MCLQTIKEPKKKWTIGYKVLKREDYDGSLISAQKGNLKDIKKGEWLTEDCYRDGYWGDKCGLQTDDGKYYDHGWHVCRNYEDAELIARCMIKHGYCSTPVVVQVQCNMPVAYGIQGAMCREMSDQECGVFKEIKILKQYKLRLFTYDDETRTFKDLEV